MNKLTIIGNLTRDPELRTTQSGISVCTFTIAVNRRRGSNAEAGQPEADFFRVSAWRQLGENCAKYLAKGRKVGVTGSLQNRSYDAQDGTKRYITEIVADEVEFLTSAAASGAPRDTEIPLPEAPPCVVAFHKDYNKTALARQGLFGTGLPQSASCGYRLRRQG